jgi:Ni/Fe-hydrogenase subunit HybB-like protein
LLNRINTFIVAYTPSYELESYFPSIGEISVTVGFVATIVLLYRAAVRIFPIISVPEPSLRRGTKYALRGGSE